MCSSISLHWWKGGVSLNWPTLFQKVWIGLTNNDVIFRAVDFLWLFFFLRRRKKTETCTEQLRFTSLMFPYFAYLFIVCLCFNIACTVSGCRNWIYQLLTVFYSRWYRLKNTFYYQAIRRLYSNTQLLLTVVSFLMCNMLHIAPPPIPCTFIYSLLF